MHVELFKLSLEPSDLVVLLASLLIVMLTHRLQVIFKHAKV